MLRPELMSRVSITGSRAVMDDVIKAVHGSRLVHLSDYDGSWAAFEPGNPVEGADEASERLVTVRSLESILDVEEADAGPTRIVTDEAIETELEEIRREVNALDDRRDEIETELRTVTERLDAMAPFTVLGIDLDLLSGYDTLQVAVGEGDADAVEAALADADDVDRFELFTGDGVVAAFARPVEGAPEDALSEALVGVDFAALEVPDVGELTDDGALSPEEYAAELRHQAQGLESRLAEVESDLEDVRLDAAGFLLAVEERLAIDVQKREAPLSFATTRRSFVAEGWVPADGFDALEAAVADAVGDRAAVDELERLDHEEYAREHAHHGEPEEAEPAPGGEDAAAAAPQAVSNGGAGDGADNEADDGGRRAAPDGGEPATHRGVVTMGDPPPVRQHNPAPSRPFELLVQMVDLPRYDEWDPTVILFLTFPFFFGFMIGDLGYGILYAAIGYAMYTRLESPALRALGGVAIWAGVFTMAFGVLYGEFFGLHQLGELYGGPVFHKGLQPAEIAYAKGWIVLSVVAGIAHLALGYLLAFGKELPVDPVEAVMESGSWLLMLFGLWGWLFSDHLGAQKPDFLIGPTSVFNGHPLPLGFTGLPASVGIAGLVAFVVGLVMIARASPVEFVEALFLQVFVNGLSYTRMAAVLLAKAGMAFIVNLLVFGAYADHGEFHFIYFADHAPAEELVIFAGLVNASDPVGAVVGWIAGIVVLVAGHLVVLGLGVTSAGLQAVRLEYVEFFSKFYEGGGRAYEPFGYERRFTTED